MRGFPGYLYVFFIGCRGVSRRFAGSVPILIAKTAHRKNLSTLSVITALNRRGEGGSGSIFSPRYVRTVRSVLGVSGDRVSDLIADTISDISEVLIRLRALVAGVRCCSLITYFIYHFKFRGHRFQQRLSGTSIQAKKQNKTTHTKNGHHKYKLYSTIVCFSRPEDLARMYV